MSENITHSPRIQKNHSLDIEYDDPESATKGEDYADVAEEENYSPNRGFPGSPIMLMESGAQIPLSRGNSTHYNEQASSNMNTQLKLSVKDCIDAVNRPEILNPFGQEDIMPLEEINNKINEPTMSSPYFPHSNSQLGGKLRDPGNSSPLQNQGIRKCSLVDCDDDTNLEEVKNQEEQDLRRLLNQKLIKNKNHFMDFVAGKDQKPLRVQHPDDSNKYQQSTLESNQPRHSQRQQQHYVMILDKRSRSETPNKMTATDMLFRTHQKLQTRRKESPAKILEKHQQRQKKAEEIRTQIENSKKKWYQKIRVRQLIAKQKWKELMAEKKRAFYDKLEQAEERRETEIEILRNKAKQENQKFDETNYIVKMTMNNMKLDMTMKMTDVLERKNQILEENKRKHHDRHLKEEAAEKRRQDLIKEHENKISRLQQKREQAVQRRNIMLQKRRRAAEEYQKRIKVLQRKNDLDKISDVMSSVNNSEFIWEFLGNDNEWQDLGLSEQDDLIYELISKDYLEIQKYKLKRDAELLNKIIQTDDQGNLFARREFFPLIHKMNKRRRKNYGELTSSSESGNESEYVSDRFIYDNIDYTQEVNLSPKARISTNANVQTPKISKREIINTEESKGVHDNLSDNSGDKDSVAEESILQGNSEDKLGAILGFGNSQEFSGGSMINQVYPMSSATQILSDEAKNYTLNQNRIKMSMKRNILKKSLSEDLTWADFLKNENHYHHSFSGPNFMTAQARSMYSTPERKAEVPSEYDKEESETLSLQEHHIVNHKYKKGKGKRMQASASQSSIASGPNGKKGVSQSSGKNHHSTQNSFIMQGVASSLPQLSQNQSTSNLSDKQSRISSVVYPSTKKKNPKNEKQMLSQTLHSNDLSNHLTGSLLGGLAAYKHKGSLCGSNTSSTHSLLLHQIETPREGGNSNNITLNQGRRSLVIESDSGRKKHQHSHRLNQSGGQYDISGLIPQNIFNSSLGNPNITTMMNSSVMDQLDEKQYFDLQASGLLSHTGSQMNQLITNSKPIPSLNKTIPKKLTVNANKLLFPLLQQKLLLKRPGKDGQFGKFKISLKIEEMNLSKITAGQLQLNQSQPLPSSILQAAAQSIIQTFETVIDQSKVTLPDQILLKKTEEPEPDPPIQRTKTSEGEAKDSQVLTPVMQSRRKDSTDTNNSSNQVALNASIIEQSQPVGTPPTQPSKLLRVQQKFLEKLQSSFTTTSGGFTVEQSQNLIKKKNALINQQHLYSSTTEISASAIECTPSPKKDYSQLKPPSKFIQDDDQIIPAPHQITDAFPQTPVNSDYKDFLVKALLIDNIQHLKLEDTQKTIFLEGDEAIKLIDYLELNELQIRYCRLCDLIIPDHQTYESHVQAKSHKKIRDDLQIKDFEDLQLSMLTIHSVPGDIEKELLREKEKALKRKVKRIKAQMIASAVNHEAAASCPGKEFISQNKKRCQILCIELEKQVIPIIKDYEALESSLKEIIKIQEMRKQADLHLMRKLKFIPILIEICKRISVCHKNEFKHLGKALEYVIKIIATFCGLRENRNYMLQTNRMSALIELLNWCLNRPTQLFYGINFVPQLFYILTLHVKHKTPYECQQMKELFIEYLISSQITMKIKGKLQIINGPLDLSEMMGQVPLFLLKSATFLESLTTLISMDAIHRPVYEKTEKIAEHVFFVIQNTELFGIVQMIATILLTRNQPFKPSQNTLNGQQKILPQTILSLAITSIKIINNVYRMDCRFAQQIMSDFEIQEQLYHLFNYILNYTAETADKQEDSKELLHETIILIGYFCLSNEKNQALLCRGESTIIQKLCALPISYFHDKKLKEILFPTLIQASYKNERSFAIMDQEISIDMLLDYLKTNIKEELPRIIEEENDYQSMSSMSHSNAAFERRSHRSPSISSTNSSQCSLQIDMIQGSSPFVALQMRFPKKLWKDAIQFYSQVLY